VPWTAAAASTARALAEAPARPPATAITATPVRATTLPATTRAVTRSPRNPAASRTLNTGAVATRMLAVPAATCTSPQFSSSW
jgi:hypothetical protein